MISEKIAKSYCKDDISLIENYDKAIADNTQTWVCHHRRETIFTPKDLKEIGEYYNRSACELIFLTKAEHNKVHNKFRPQNTKGFKHSSHCKEQHALRATGSFWINNGEEEKFVKNMIDGYVKGRLPGRKRPNQSIAMKKHWNRV